MHDPHIWFRRKRIGFGWSPNTWEGWAVMALVIGAVVLVGRMLRA